MAIRGPRVLHGLFYGLDLSNPDDEIRAVVRRRLIRGVEIAAELGGNRIAVHSPFTLWGRRNDLNCTGYRDALRGERPQARPARKRCPAGGGGDRLLTGPDRPTRPPGALPRTPEYFWNSEAARQGGAVQTPTSLPRCLPRDFIVPEILRGPGQRPGGRGRARGQDRGGA
jgi:hypothetical protein